MSVSLAQARAAKPAVLRRFRCLGDVVSIGITRVRGDYAVKVNLGAPLPADVEVPSHVDGVPVRVEVTGRITPR